MSRRTLPHEVWEDVDDDGEPFPVLCHAGPLGDGVRYWLGPGARLLATFEAEGPFEAMTTYFRLVGWGRYYPDQAWDFGPYPGEWFEGRD